MRRELDVEWKVGPGAEEGIKRGVDHPPVQVGLLRVHRESNLHRRMINSPLNTFFRSWPNFPFHVLTTWFAFKGMMACFGGVGDEVSLAGEIFGA
jgi:hypothetical protein